jgi:FkbM family methyltransferase
MDTAILPMVDGCRVVVPDKVTQITSYVLAEQQDWFEDELRFIRRMLQPGSVCIDVGAGLGVYSLSMARRVGSTGRVIAFEPFSSNANLLAQSIFVNQMPWIQLDRRAVTDRSGTVELLPSSFSESTCVHHADRDGPRHTIPVKATKLDDFVSESSMSRIDVIKIDAEGEEAAIIRGAGELLRRQSPVILYEIRAHTIQDLGIAESLAEFGYESYRLVPGLNLLVPIEPRKSLDSFVLNLFACKPETADQLAKARMLVRDRDIAERRSAKLTAPATESSPYDYRQWLIKQPFAEGAVKDWKRTVSAGKSEPVVEALQLYGISRDILREPIDRYLALTSAFSIMSKLCEHPTIEYARAATLARIALDLGMRSAALTSLARLMQSYHTQRRIDTSEPFLSPSSRFDAIRPRDAIGSWLVASATEAFEYARHYSSFWAEEDSIQRLESIRDLGYASDETTRRLTLYQRLQAERKKLQLR